MCGSLIQPLSGLMTFSRGSPGEDRRAAALRRSNPGLDYTSLSGLLVVGLGQCLRPATPGGCAGEGRRRQTASRQGFMSLLHNVIARLQVSDAARANDADGAA